MEKDTLESLLSFIKRVGDGYVPSPTSPWMETLYHAVEKELEEDLEVA